MRKGFLLLALSLVLASITAALAAGAEKEKPADVAEKDEKKILFKEFKDYKPLFFTLNIGYEYTSINKALETGFPRIGLFLYAIHYQRSLKNTSTWTLGVHQSFTAQLTGSAEQQTNFNPSIQLKNLGDKRALEVETQLFFPVLKTQYGAQIVGPIGVLGGKKADDVSKFDGRYYYGLRLARNPEMYADFLYGKTESISSGRLEARGQFPIFKNIFLGAIGNFGIQNRDTSTEADTVRIYLTWNVDAADFFENVIGFFEKTSKGKKEEEKKH